MSEKSSSDRPHVLVVGGGFAGLAACRGLAREPVRVTLIDRRNYHLFQPLLYQVATGGLSPAEISAPLRAILAAQKNAEVLLEEVTGFDLAERRVMLGTDTINYDFLVVAAGATHHYFGHDDWELVAPGLKSIEDATRIRANLLAAFERAELESDPERRQALMTFVIVGAGPTGVELAGALAELAHWTLPREFRRIDPTQARILLVDGADRILPTFPAVSSQRAQQSLQRLGVEVLCETRVTAISKGRVTLKGPTDETAVTSETVLWASGVTASPLGTALARSTGVELQRGGRIEVTENLTLADFPEVFVLGDMAAATDGAGHALPGTAPVAMQQGRYAAQRIRDGLRGRTKGPFRYRDKGQLAVIGRAAAVAEVGGIRFSGYPAWLLWLFVHIMYLAGYANRFLVLFEW
ncbi:MAG: NAD(P)/FAD-dependent oxidoreductase, partial [Thermoanaerobaculia bacterium]|nr:NAD(P)/FAD-dependent oxidoreductase [Thermoanaerobaculia bacterium]